MIYYTSDLHFCHENIIKLCNRPFKNIEEMNEHIINKWNSKVGIKDKVYILGDVYFRCKDYKWLENNFNRLNGEKYLILGNHDSLIDTIDWYKYFKWIGNYKKIVDSGRKVILFHYPIEEWDGFFRGSYHLYGHVHNSDNGLRKIDRRYNVGVDVNDFEPKTLDELIERNKND